MEMALSMITVECYGIVITVRALVPQQVGELVPFPVEVAPRPITVEIVSHVIPRLVLLPGGR